jgi:hypothetical protein
MQSIGGTCAGTSGRVHGQSTCVFLTDTRSGAQGAKSPGNVAALACTSRDRRNAEHCVFSTDMRAGGTRGPIEDQVRGQSAAGAVPSA